MKNNLRYIIVSVVGGFLTFIGAVFILLPGPAFLFLPVGLAILSLEHNWAKSWLKRCQRWMRKGAVQADKWLHKSKVKLSRTFKKR